MRSAARFLALVFGVVVHLQGCSGGGGGGGDKCGGGGGDKWFDKFLSTTSIASQKPTFSHGDTTITCDAADPDTPCAAIGPEYDAACNEMVSYTVTLEKCADKEDVGTIGTADKAGFHSDDPVTMSYDNIGFSLWASGKACTESGYLCGCTDESGKPATGGVTVRVNVDLACEAKKTCGDHGEFPITLDVLGPQPYGPKPQARMDFLDEAKPAKVMPSFLLGHGAVMKIGWPRVETA